MKKLSVTWSTLTLLLSVVCLFLSMSPAFAGVDDVDRWGGYVSTCFAVVPVVISLASALANLTKTDKDNRFIMKAQKVFDFFALNWTVRGR